MFDPSDIEKLAELFTPKSQNSDSEDELEKTPGNACKKETGTDKSRPKKDNPYAKVENNETKRREVLNDEYYEMIDDQDQAQSLLNWKATPSWDITYKQQVTASDVFLQMGLKNPTTASCEDMIVTIHLPGEKRQNVDLKIKQQDLILESAKFHLDLHLPHPVDPQKGNAKFDGETEKLTITLRMDRELDLVNF